MIYDILEKVPPKGSEQRYDPNNFDPSYDYGGKYFILIKNKLELHTLPTKNIIYIVLLRLKFSVKIKIYVVNKSIY